ncbi:hypothetical protein [Methylocystis bryophila]|uniref:Solute-binding protein family 3/N-terminal domain-containing protein n=1 Tax=Methylocystis bryophila TaxID=655015 RepID=A0A1W6MXM7_9HYPH|nr:hypothetical protein [Methylocystis bryophila]ARN82323.1 hypothetical protein B1812_15875 [Methylocystis bryophila]BDV38474.1 amino acid ABC transporter substrate-binding protein [Methylocystis bryophila]
MQKLPFVIAIACALSNLSVSPCVAGALLDRVKQRGSVTCAAVQRPGLAKITGGEWRGMLLDYCRAIALGALGPEGRIDFRELETPLQYDGARAGDDDVLFLTGTEIVENDLSGAVLPGPVVYRQAHAALVEETSPIRKLEEIANKSVCFLQTTATAKSLEFWLGHNKLNILRVPFEEPIEFLDAYNVRRCAVAVGEETELAEVKARRGVQKFSSRILPEKIAVFPIFAATPIQDAQWSALVAYTVMALQAAERPQTDWSNGGAKALSINGAAIGLDKSWQTRVVDAFGGHAAIYDRNLGEGSPLRLPRGVDALWSDGGLGAPAYAE